MSFDLPLELWLHIFSFLPKGYIRRMIGVNRKLFQLALDEIYREVRLVSDSCTMASTFIQLGRRPSLARRVRHLYVRPGFLPGMGAPIPPNPSRYRDIKGKWSLLHGRLRSLCSHRRGTVQAERVLTLAQAAIHRCGNIRELTIVLHDLSISPPFAMFLKSSWTCLAAHLRKLTIDVTLAKLPLIWEESESCRLPALEELEVSLAYSRVSCHDGQVLINDVLLPFTTSHTRTLRSLIVSSALPLDWSPYFNGLGCFPLLQKLALVLTISSVTLSEPMALTRLIDNHRQTLRRFSVRKNYGYTSDIPHDSLYATWIVDEFSMLVLPALETLEMGLWPNLPYRSPLRLYVIPPASSLVSLSIVDFVLYDVQVEAILDALYVGSDGSRRLQCLQISVLFLHPHLVDLLATKLPGLKFLDLTFEHLAASTSVTINCRYTRTKFKAAMRTRMYTGWKLEYLKLSLKSPSCGHGHYELGCMKTVARCIPREVSFGLENGCFCGSPTVVPPMQRK